MWFSSWLWNFIPALHTCKGIYRDMGIFPTSLFFVDPEKAYDGLPKGTLGKGWITQWRDSICRLVCKVEFLGFHSEAVTRLRKRAGMGQKTAPSAVELDTRVEIQSGVHVGQNIKTIPSPCGQ